MVAVRYEHRMVTRERPRFGAMLRAWRARRGMSQLQLSLRADVSTRHVSFVESGRSKPSREMVLHLCRALQVPLRESNDLLLAAGFAPAHAETALDGPALAAANTAIDLILRHHEPLPAVAMDRHWNLVRSNAAATQLFARLLGERARPGPANVVRLVFAADGLRPCIANWAEVAHALLDRVRAEAPLGVVDDATQRLLDDVAADPELSARPFPEPVGPLIPVRFRQRDLALAFFSTVTTLGTPRDIALQELRIECFFPADAATRAAMARPGGDAGR